MDTHHSATSGRSGSKRPLGELHLLLLSIAIGFLIAFGGSLLLAELLRDDLP
ncbi:MAG: hypothetical protein U0893_01290 [Chloroflexota bacterium]|mgnify:CR=1 FL=1